VRSKYYLLNLTRNVNGIPTYEFHSLCLLSQRSPYVILEIFRMSKPFKIRKVNHTAMKYILISLY
jgi:hypothetical protein